MKKVKKIAFWVLTLAYLVVAFSFVSDKHFKMVCKNIRVFIVDSSQNSFINDKDIINLLTKSGSNVIGQPLEMIDAEQLEKKIAQHPSVINSEVYKTIDGSINVDVDQRNPLIRVFTTNGTSFYIDENGKFMPLSTKYTSHLLIANGNINAKIDFESGKNVFNSENKVLKDIYIFGKFLKDNEFWNSQIEQVYILANKEFELIPRVGSHVILLGDINNLETKLNNLKKVYLKGFRKESWTKYEHINLKYNNQVICTKR